MKTALLLGATGQLGKLVALSAPESISLHALSSSQLDITNSAELSEALSTIKPDLIINTAAYTQVDLAESEQDKAYSVNADAVMHLATLAHPSIRVVHLSTDFVFSEVKKSPYFPEDSPHPVSVYGKSKLEGEKALLGSRPDNSVVLRTSWLYSAGSRNFVTVMLEMMSSKEELHIVNDQFGSPTSANTLAEVVWKLACTKHANGIYHWSDSGVISWYDFAKEIQRQGLAMGLLKKEIPLQTIPSSQYPTTAKRPAYSALDSSATEKLLGFKTRPWQVQLASVLKNIQELDSAYE